MTNVKTCTKCKETKSLDQFGKNSGQKSGLNPSCKKCQSVAGKAYYDANKDRVLAKSKAWHQTNKLHKRALSKKLYEGNKASVIARTTAWSKANPALSAAMLGKSYATRRGQNSVPDDFDLHATVPFYAERIRLTKETGVVHHVDHIIPLAAGGLHEASNLQVLTAEENTSKGANE